LLSNCDFFLQSDDIGIAHTLELLVVVVILTLVILV
jgi:hypothetical protein